MSHNNVCGIAMYEEHIGPTEQASDETADTGKPGKFCDFIAQCRQLPSDIILEILDYIELQLSVSEIYEPARDFARKFAGIFQDDPCRRPVVLRRSIDIGPINTLYNRLKLPHARGGMMLPRRDMLRFLLRHARRVAMAVSRETQPFGQDLQQICTRNGLFDEVESVKLAVFCQSFEDLIPSTLLGKVRSLNLWQHPPRDIERTLPNIRDLEMQYYGDVKDLVSELPESMLGKVECLVKSGVKQLPKVEIERVMQRASSVRALALETATTEELTWICQTLKDHQEKLKLLTYCSLNVACISRIPLGLALLPNICTSLVLFDCIVQTLDGIELFHRLYSLTMRRVQIHETRSWSQLSLCGQLEELSIDILPISRLQEGIHDLTSRGQLKFLELEFASSNEKWCCAVLSNVSFGSKCALRGVALRLAYFSSLDPVNLILSSCSDTLEYLTIHQFVPQMREQCTRLAEELVSGGELLSADFQVASR